MNTDVRSIVDMAQGAIKERVDYEMSHILDNIRDPNTRADRKRTLTLNLVFLMRLALNILADAFSLTLTL